MVGNDHKVATLPPREVKPLQLTPEEAEALSWREDYDRRRVEALANGWGCGRCIKGVVHFKVMGKAVDTTPCNCSHVPAVEN